MRLGVLRFGRIGGDAANARGGGLANAGLPKIEKSTKSERPTRNDWENRKRLLKNSYKTPKATHVSALRTARGGRQTCCAASRAPIQARFIMSIVVVIIT